jgi:hypothetical protein
MFDEGIPAKEAHPVLLHAEGKAAEEAELALLFVEGIPV